MTDCSSPPSPISNHESSKSLSVVAASEEEEEEPIPCVISPEIMTKEITREKWVCDFCKNATFDDFQDACDHEALCQAQKATTRNESAHNQKLYATEKKKENVYPPHIANESIDKTESTPMKPKQLKFLATEKRKKCCQFESCQVCEDKETKSKTAIDLTTKKACNKSKKSSPEVQIVSTKKVKMATASIFLKPAKSAPFQAKTNKSTISNVPTNGKKASSTTTKQQNIAAIFQNPSQKSALMAEHRAAEFAAKRRLQQEAEKERERKRQETRKALYEEKQKKLANAAQPLFQVTPAKDTPKNIATGSKQSPIDLTIDTPQNQKFGIVKKIRAKDLRAYPPRFPAPSHVIQSERSENDGRRYSYCSKDQYEQFIRTSQYPSGKDSVSSELNDILPCQLPLEEVPNFPSDVLHQSFSRVLNADSSDYYIKDDTTNLLWSDKYTMKTLPHDIYGEENKQIAQNLIDFIQEWKGHRQRMYQARAEAREKAKRKGKKRPKKFEYFSEDDIWSDQEDGGLCNLFLLTGEVGSGKTSLVHAAAKNCQCPLIEINSTLERGGKALKRAIEESTQSESSLALLKHSNSLDAFGILDEGDNDEEGIQNSSLAIILIDEVDLLFETDGDSGFWQGLSAVAKKAKCPIILTSTLAPRQLSNFRFKQGHLERPKAFECASKMCQIARMEGMKWQQGVDQDTIKNELAAIARICGCDLRRIMNEMQLYRFGRSCEVLKNIPSNSYGDENKKDLFFPRIKTVFPRTVSSCSYSVVAISGANFTFAGFVETSSVIPTVYFGDQVSPLARVIDDNSILAVCPPCDIPENIDSSCCYRNTYDESLCTKFRLVTVELRYANGAIYRSDASVSILEMGQFCPSTFIEYSFEDISETETKETVVMTSEEMKVLLDSHPLSRDSRKNQSTKRSSIRSSQSELDAMVKLSDTLAIESDSIFIKDGIDFFGLKHLTGIMRDDQDLSNDEVGLACGWLENGNRMGAPETYMTRPTSRRDIILIANCFAHARGSANFNADAIIPSPPEEEINPATDVWTHLENDEDIFISNGGCSDMYNRIFLKQSMGQKRMNIEALNRKDYFVKEVDKLSEFIIIDERQSSNMTDESYWLDYVPTLRRMGTAEEILQNRYNAMVANTDLDFKQGSRRSGRRSRRNDDRYHYFESVLESPAYRLNNDEAREISMQLSKLELKYHTHGYENEF